MWLKDGFLFGSDEERRFDLHRPQISNPVDAMTISRDNHQSTLARVSVGRPTMQPPERISHLIPRLNMSDTKILIAQLQRHEKNHELWSKIEGDEALSGLQSDHIRVLSPVQQLHSDGKTYKHFEGVYSIGQEGWTLSTMYEFRDDKVPRKKETVRRKVVQMTATYRGFTASAGMTLHDTGRKRLLHQSYLGNRQNPVPSHELVGMRELFNLLWTDVRGNAWDELPLESLIRLFWDDYPERHEFGRQQLSLMEVIEDDVSSTDEWDFEEHRWVPEEPR
jgi:hypothetical protein